MAEILDHLSEEWLIAIERSSPREQDERERAYAMMYGISRFRTKLYALIDDEKSLSLRLKDGN